MSESIEIFDWNFVSRTKLPQGGIVVVNERAELAVAKVVEAVCERSEQAGNDLGIRRA